MALTCCICLESAQEKSQARVTLCGHVFCAECCGIWFGNENYCPVCRAVLDASQLITIFDQGPTQENAPIISPDQEGIEQNREGTEAVDEDVQVKQVLLKVASRWQSHMCERAKLKARIAALEKENEDLTKQLERSREEHADTISQLQSNSNGWLRSKDGVSAWQRSNLQTNGSDDDSRDRVLAFHEDAEEPSSVGRGAIRPVCDAAMEERFRAPAWELAHTYDAHTDPVHGIAVHSEGHIVATASWDHLCKLYDLESEDEVGCLVGHRLGLYAVAFSKRRPSVIGTVSSDQTCRLWDMGGECLRVLESHTDEVNGLCFQEGSNLLATASDDMTSIIWDSEKGVPVTVLQGHQNVVYGVCFQPQGHLIATASFDWTAKLWDPRTGEDVQTLAGHHEDVIGVDMDDTGQLLVTGSDDTTARVWDLRMGQPLAVLRDHTGEVKRVTFSPYSRLLATASGDATARIFDTATFECRHVLSSHSDHVFDVAWSPSAEFVVTASHDGFWKLWRPSRSGAGGRGGRRASLDKG